MNWQFEIPILVLGKEARIEDGQLKNNKNKREASIDLSFKNYYSFLILSLVKTFSSIPFRFELLPSPAVFISIFQNKTFSPVSFIFFLLFYICKINTNNIEKTTLQIFFFSFFLFFVLFLMKKKKKEKKNFLVWKLPSHEVWLLIFIFVFWPSVKWDYFWFWSFKKEREWERKYFVKIKSANIEQLALESA